MAFNISRFTSQGLPFGGARSAYFEVILNTPSGIPNIGEKISLTCKAAQLPGSTLTSIPVRYFGRETKHAGTRTFQPWQIIVLNDEDFAVRHALELWSNSINRHEQNVRDAAFHRNSQYRTTALVTQYSKVNVPIRTYELVNAWPQEVAPIDLNWDNAEAIQEYGVIIEYDFWRPVAPSTTGSFSV